MISRRPALGNAAHIHKSCWMTTSQLDALQEIWADRMPLTTAMAIEAVTGDAALLTVRLPLGPNRNHKGTVFAGSLSALATVTGWSALWLMARDAGLNPHIVLQDANIRYLRPARGDVTATCPIPDPSTRERLLGVYRRRGRVRTTLAVSIVAADGEVVAVFEGRYVVHRLDVFSDDRR
jgi:thioesterase domain-containing protein